MNISDFMQMLQMNPNPTPGPAQQPINGGQQENVPRGTSGGFNILERGADTAINTARQALGARSHDKMRPFVNTLSDALTASFESSGTPFGQAMAKRPFNPYAQQDAQLQENMKIADYLHKAEEARRRHSYQQQVLGEQARHHRASEAAQYARAAGRTGLDIVNIGGKDVDLSGFSPIEGKSEFNRLQKAKSTYGGVLHSIDNASKQLNALDKITEKDFMRPTDAFLGGISQKYTNIKASGGNEHAIAERNATKVLNDSLTKVRILIESATKGGLPGEQMMRRFEEKGILPHLGDSSSTIREKLGVIKEEVSKLRASADISLKTRRNIDVIDLESLGESTAPAPAGNYKPVDQMSLAERKAELAKLEAARGAQ